LGALLLGIGSMGGMGGNTGGGLPSLAVVTGLDPINMPPSRAARPFKSDGEVEAPVEERGVDMVARKRVGGG
jgi:hypothetical protein